MPLHPVHMLLYLHLDEKPGRSMQRGTEELQIEWSRNVWRGNHYQQNEDLVVMCILVSWLPEVTTFMHSFTYPSAHAPIIFILHHTLYKYLGYFNLTLSVLVAC